MVVAFDFCFDRSLFRLVVECSALVLCLTFSPIYANAQEPFPQQGNNIKDYAETVINDVRSNPVGASIGQDFLNRGPDYTRKHPWINGNRNWPLDWRKDSLDIVEQNMNKFFECAEPRLVDMPCDYCQPHFTGMFVDDNCYIPFMNPGQVIEYWWPELEIEVNNFGISVIEPAANGRLEYTRQLLMARLEQQLRPQVDEQVRRYSSTAQANLPGALSRDPHGGNSHWSGMTPIDQTEVGEAHTFLTEVQDRSADFRTKGDGYCGKVYVRIYNACVQIGKFWYNGWMKGNSQKCFYDALDPEDDVIKPWTEDMQFAPTWRFPTKSEEINSEFYQASLPFNLSPAPAINIQRIKNSSYARTASCDSFRLETWPNIYGDLETALGITGLSEEPLDTICYKGGEQLYPLTGTLVNQHNPLVAGAFLSRRALELLGMLGDEHLEMQNSSNSSSSSSADTKEYWDNHGWQHINKFTRRKRDDYDLSRGLTEIDKLQRVAPDVSRCFHLGEVGEYNNETRNLFPPDVVRPSDNGSIRYIYWNKRKMCTCEMRGKFSALEEDAGNDSCTSSWMKRIWGLDNKGWGCQMYPRRRLDKARGNVEEGRIEGSRNFMARMPIMCAFPFRGFSACGFMDWMDENYDGGSGGGDSGGGGNTGGGMKGGSAFQTDPISLSTEIERVTGANYSGEEGNNKSEGSSSGQSSSEIEKSEFRF